MTTIVMKMAALALALLVGSALATECPSELAVLSDTYVTCVGAM